MASKRVYKVAVAGLIFLVMLTVSWAQPVGNIETRGNNEHWTTDHAGFGLEKRCNYTVLWVVEDCEYIPEARRTLDALHDAGLYYVTDIEALAP